MRRSLTEAELRAELVQIHPWHEREDLRSRIRLCLPRSPKSRKRYLQAAAEKCQRIGQVPPIDFFLNFGTKIRQEARLANLKKANAALKEKGHPQTPKQRAANSRQRRQEVGSPPAAETGVPVPESGVESRSPLVGGEGD